MESKYLCRFLYEERYAKLVTVNKMDITKLTESIGMITEPRRQWGHICDKLEDILIIGLCCVICQGEDYENMELFGNERLEWFNGYTKKTVKTQLGEVDIKVPRDRNGSF